MLHKRKPLKRMNVFIWHMFLACFHPWKDKRRILFTETLLFGRGLWVLSLTPRHKDHLNLKARMTLTLRNPLNHAGASYMYPPETPLTPEPSFIRPVSSLLTTFVFQWIICWKLSGLMFLKQRMAGSYYLRIWSEKRVCQWKFLCTVVKVVALAFTCSLA